MVDYARWNYPTDIRYGCGVIGDLGDLCRELSLTHPLFVTDPGLSNLGMTKDAVQCCRDANIQLDIFAAIKSNPTLNNIQHGAELFRQGRYDSVIAFGGGSALDAGKAIALLSGQKYPLWDFEDIDDNWKKADITSIPPIIAIPTTSGTGSEVGRVSVITDEKKTLKRLIFHPNMLPSAVLLDPELTVGLSSKLTAATGMDALSHNLEAYCSPSDHPMARGIAIEGCRLVSENLTKVTKNGHDIEARGRMLIAATMGATAFQKGLGAMHALAHSIGGIFDNHHGTLNAILMPYVLVSNKNAVEQDIKYLSKCLNLGVTFDSFLEWVIVLRKELEIPHTLSEINLSKTAARAIGKMAEKDPSALTNPIIFTAEDYEKIYLKSISGDMN